MKTVTQIMIAFSATLIMASCGNSSKDDKAIINDKKAAIEKLKAESAKNEAEIKKLQTELEKIDSNTANAAKIKLVSTAPVVVQDFKHYIDLLGHVDADNISLITPRMGPSQVKAVFVVQGQYVKKGQLLLKLDDAILQHQLATGKQGLESLKTQLSFAKNLYQRQKNLWDQGIGTEVQLISAKNNVDALENQLRQTTEQVKIFAEQLNTSNVYSDVNGVADIVNVRVGEIFQGMLPNGSPQIKIVNTSSLKVVTSVPENYLTRLHKGSVVEISIPDANKKVTSSLSVISQAIDLTQRGFIAEAKIPADPALKPNQTAIMRILDYAASNAVVIPVNIVQSDETGKYVYLISKANGKAIVRKQTVIIGEVYGDNVEIKAGLKGGEELVTDGYQALYEGQVVSVVAKQ